MPEPICKEAIEILNENIKRFKSFMNKLDNIEKDNNDLSCENETDKDIEKISCLKNLKNLISKNTFFFIF